LYVFESALLSMLAWEKKSSHAQIHLGKGGSEEGKTEGSHFPIA
jgi:hypothetical protein